MAAHPPKVNRKRPEYGGICSACESDLTVIVKRAPAGPDTPYGEDSDGYLYCSNDECEYSIDGGNAPHPSGKEINGL